MRANEDKQSRWGPLSIGMRTIKTALAVFICMVLYQLIEDFGHTSQFDAFLAVVAAIICMQDTMEKSVSSGYTRFFGTLIGAFLGMGFLYLRVFFNNDYLFFAICAVGVVILITLCNFLKINNAIIIGCVVFLVIVMGQTVGSPFQNSVRRLLDTVVGIVIAVAINHFIHNPDVKGRTEDKDDA
jgi:uncharacterized membrane protein YgaE (UPF0421/DUF939 family)